MAKKTIIPLVIAGAALSAYLLTRQTVSLISPATSLSTTSNTGFSQNLWYFDKMKLDYLEYEEQGLVTRVWERAAPYLDSIVKYGSEYSVYIPIILAIILAESTFDPAAYRYEVSLGTGSIGLMQLLPATARQMGFSGSEVELYDPDTNIKYGTKYIDYQRDRYGSDVKKIAAAYNAGSVRYASSGAYINQTYADKINNYYKIISTVVVKRTV